MVSSSLDFYGMWDEFFSLLCVLYDWEFFIASFLGVQTELEHTITFTWTLSLHYSHPTTHSFLEHGGNGEIIFVCVFVFVFIHPEIMKSEGI